MSSGRRYNVQRHIEKIHQGYSQAIRYTEYIVGRCDRIYSIPLDLPKARPSYEKNVKADATNDNQLMCEMIKACTQMYCAQQRQIFPTYSTSTSHQETTVDKDPFLEAAKKMVDQFKVVKIKDPSLEAAKKKLDQLQINNVNDAGKNSLNNQMAASHHEMDFKEIARMAVDRLFASKEKNAASKNP
jgi:2-phospho-L-lactate guanylyltransferase (CobY/MobA/RfbA family)